MEMMIQNNTKTDNFDTRNLSGDNEKSTFKKGRGSESPALDKNFGVPSLGIHESIGESVSRSHSRKIQYIDVRRPNIMFGEQKVKRSPSNRSGSPVNDIIVKIEMKKFQNLIKNRQQRKNNLVN